MDDETNRMPYNCTFCDWNSGLHNKMVSKMEVIKQEVTNFGNVQREIIWF